MRCKLKQIQNSFRKVENLTEGNRVSAAQFNPNNKFSITLYFKKKTTKKKQQQQESTQIIKYFNKFYIDTKIFNRKCKLHSWYSQCLSAAQTCVF